MRLLRPNISGSLLLCFFVFLFFGKTDLKAKKPNLNEASSSALVSADCGLFVDIGANCLIPCDSTEFFVSYGNLETASVNDVYVEITLDESISMGESDLGFVSLGNNRFRFDFGTLASGETGGFSFTAFVSCDAEEGEVHVNVAHIFPDDLCPPDPNWDGSDVEVEINCIGDSIYFNLENIGGGDMTDPSQFYIIEDDVVIMLQGFQLPSGESTTIVLPNNGGGYHLEAGQTEGNPYGSFDNASTEGCDNVTVGFVEQFSEADVNLAIDIYKRACEANCDGIEKLAFPEGFGPQNNIGSNLPIEYQFNFFNPGPDTISQITICDTLSLFLDISTALPGASSHDYVVDFPGGDVVKFVFDDINLLPGESGFVKMHICQSPNNPAGTVIPNVATIFMDGDSTLTNDVFHTIPSVEVTTVDTTICGDGGYFGIPVTEDITLEFTNVFSIFTSQLTVNVTHFEGTEDQEVSEEICEGESFEIGGETFTEAGEYEIPMTDPDGCPYTVNLDLTVIENHEVVYSIATCQPDTVEFFGEVLSESDTYFHVEDNDEGCYDIFILNLTVLPNFNVTTDTSICEGESIEWNGQVYTESTQASVTYSTLNGCDSTLTLDLEVLPAPDSTFEVVLMEGETFEYNGTVLSEAGVYEFSFPLGTGCDSTVFVIVSRVPPNEECFADAGPDTLICGYSTDLVAAPSGGTWEAVCPGAPGLVDMDNINDSTVNVTVSDCGTYFFRYNIFNIDSMMVFDTLLMDSVLVVDTCSVEDVVQVKFEDPSKRVTQVYTDLELGYNDYECHETDLATCLNVIPFSVVAPEEKWQFDLSSFCFTEIFDTSIDSLLGDCLANEIMVNSVSFQDSFNLSPVCYDQSAFITLGSGGTILNNTFLQFIGQLSGQASDSTSCPPPPAGCFAPVECQRDTLGSDTSYLEIPVRIGGQWQVWIDSMQIPLDDTTALTIDSIGYFFVVDPNAETYSPVNFEIWEVTPSGDWIFPNQEVSVTLSWEEIWVLDSIEIVTHDFGPTPDSCCVRGDFLGSTLGPIPGIPAFECPPFTITFGVEVILAEEDIICDSTSYILEVALSGGTAPYTFSGLAGSMVNDSLFVSEPIPMNEGYFVTFTDSTGCSVDLEGEECPCVQLEAASPQFAEIPCDSMCITLIGSGSGNVPWASEWQGPGGVSEDGVSILACEPGIYLFIVFDSLTACADTSMTEVSQSFLEAIAETGNQLDCTNNSTELFGSAQPTENGVIFFWEGPGILSGNESLQNQTVDQPGWYFLTVTNPDDGCEAVDSVEVTQSLEMPTANIDPPNNLTCDVSSVNIFGQNSVPIGQLSFEWTSGSGVINTDPTLPNIIVSEPGEYTLTVTHLESGCTAQSSVVVEDDFTPPANVSAGDDDQLDCDTEVLTLAASAASMDYNFTWITLDGNIVSGANTPNPVVDQPGIYELVVINPVNGCPAVDEVEVILDLEEPPINLAEADTLTCAATEITLDAQLSGDPDFIFQWETQTGNFPSGNNGNAVEVDAPGWYIITVFDESNGCESSDSVQVYEDENAPEAFAGLDDRFACDETVMTLEGSASSGGSEASFLWTSLSGNVLTNSTTLEPQVDQPGEYLLTVTDESNGCTATDMVEIYAYVPVSFSVENVPDCYGTAIGEIQVEVMEGYAAPYSFILENGQAEDVGLFENLTAGNYEVAVVDSNGCAETQVVEIVEVPYLPELELEEEYHFCGIGQPLELTVETGLDDEWVSYFWSNGEDLPTLSTASSGEYSIEISTVCQNRIYEFEVINDLYIATLFKMPNVFTPNGDGVNDSFGPVTPNMPAEFQMVVFNRWGNKVFQSSTANRIWDGTQNGEPAASDVYVWKMFATYNDCEGTPVTFDLKGDVTLLR